MLIHVGLEFRSWVRLIKMKTTDTYSNLSGNGIIDSSSFFFIDPPPLTSAIIVRSVIYGLCSRLQCRLRRLPRFTKSILGDAALHSIAPLLGYCSPHLRHLFVAQVQI